MGNRFLLIAAIKNWQAVVALNNLYKLLGAYMYHYKYWVYGLIKPLFAKSTQNKTAEYNQKHKINEKYLTPKESIF